MGSINLAVYYPPYEENEENSFHEIFIDFVRW